MSEPHERLREAWKKEGFKEAREVARAYGWNETTFTSHQNGQRGLRPTVADRYAKALGVNTEWLLYDRGPRDRAARKPQAANQAASKNEIPLVGYVAAGAEAHFTAAGELGTVAAPAGATESTVAVEIRGESLGAFFDRWICFYDDVRRPVTADLVGRLCVVGLEDGRVLIKKIQRSKSRGLFHLLSQTEPPIFDAAIEWAARVKNLVPR